MERTKILDVMADLKLFGMKAAYDETLATALKRQHEPQRLVGDLMRAEISEKQARSIKDQITASKLPLAKDLDDFVFKDTPINEALVRDLAGGGFIVQQRNALFNGGTRTGKSHAVIAIARSCVRAGRRGRFFTTVDLVNQLEAETRAGRQRLISPVWTSSSSTNLATCRSPRPAASLSSTSSAGSTSAPRSSSPRTSPSANGRAFRRTELLMAPPFLIVWCAIVVAAADRFARS